MGNLGQGLGRWRIARTPCLSLIACLRSPAPLIDLADRKDDDVALQNGKDIRIYTALVRGEVFESCEEGIRSPPRLPIVNHMDDNVGCILTRTWVRMDINLSGDGGFVSAYLETGDLCHDLLA